MQDEIYEYIIMNKTSADSQPTPRYLIPASKTAFNFGEVAENPYY
jgi:hypothetical protein